MSGNQTSIEGVQYVWTAVCMYVYLISYMSYFKRDSSLPSFSRPTVYSYAS